MLLLISLLTGCLEAVDTEFPGGVAYTPEVGGPEGWRIAQADAPLVCPDNTPARVYVVHPEDASGPQPVAVLLHSGAFDYVRVPALPDPLAGETHQEPSRLSFTWAARKVFATLGMGADQGGNPEVHTGALPAALANAGVTVVLPTNCWGDSWANAEGTDRANDVDADLFARNGYAMAEWTWRLVAEPGFAAAEGVELPVAVDPGVLYLLGQGEGGRGVSELLSSGHEPGAVLVDSVADDLRTYFDSDHEAWTSTVRGLERLFPGGRDQTTAGALFSQDPLPKTVYLYSSLDSRIPRGAHAAALEALTGPDHVVHDVEQTVHVTTGDDTELATQAVTCLTTDDCGLGGE